MLSLMDEGICRYKGIELLEEFLWETDPVGGTTLADDDGGTWLEGLPDDTAIDEDADGAGSKLELLYLLYGCSDKPSRFPL